MYGSKTIKNGTKHTTSKVVGKFEKKITTEDGETYTLGMSLNEFFMDEGRYDEHKALVEEERIACIRLMRSNAKRRKEQRKAAQNNEVK